MPDVSKLSQDQIDQITAIATNLADVNRNLGIANADPRTEIFNWASQQGYTPDQMDIAFGLAPGSSQQYAIGAGLMPAPQGNNSYSAGATAPTIVQDLGLTPAPTPAPVYNPAPVTQAPVTQSPVAPVYSDAGLTKPAQVMSAPIQAAPQAYTPPAPTLQPYQKNPYLDQMAAGITQQMTDNLQRNVLPGMRSGAMAAGGFGGSRQGVVEANALNDFNNSLGNNLTNLYGTDYTNQMNRNLQKYGMDQNYNLGLGNLGLGYMNSQQNYDLGLRNNDLNYATLDANIYNSNFNNQLNAANLGLNTYNTMQNSANNTLNTATNVYNTPMNYSNYFTNAYNQTAGQGGNTSQSATGNPLLGALGGAMLGSKISY